MSDDIQQQLLAARETLAVLESATRPLIDRLAPAAFRKGIDLPAELLRADRFAQAVLIATADQPAQRLAFIQLQITQEKRVIAQMLAMLPEDGQNAYRRRQLQELLDA